MTTHKEAIITLANAIESVAQTGLELEVPTGESASALETAIEVLEELYAVEEADLITGLKATLEEVNEVIGSY